MVHELTPPRLLRRLPARRDAGAPLVGRGDCRRRQGVQAVDATELIVTTDQYGGAEPLMDETVQTARASSPIAAAHSRRHRIHAPATARSS